MQVLALAQFICVGLTVITFTTGLLATTVEDGSEWLVKGDQATRKWYAVQQTTDAAQAFWQAATADDADVSTAAQAEPERSQQGYTVTFVYEDMDSGNIFTAANLEGMRQVENVLLTHPHYTKWCLLNYSAAPNASNVADVPCMPPLSPLVLFYGIPDPVQGYLERQLSDKDFSAAAQMAEANWAAYSTLVSKDFSRSNPRSKWTRCFYRFGLPVAGYSSSLSQCVPTLPVKPVSWAHL